MPDEITDEDLKTLLSSVGKRGAGNAASQAFARTPMAYDFSRPQRVNKDQVRGFENVHEQFARLLSSTLASTMRMVVDVDVAFTDQILYGEFVQSLTHPCAAYSFTMDPPGRSAVLSFAPELLMAVIDRAFGGRGSALAGDPRPLTPLEMGVVNKLATRVFQDLEATWDSLGRLRISDVVLETNPEFIQISANTEPVLVVAFEANATQASGLVHLCYPVTALEPVLDRLAPQNRQRRKQASRELTPERAAALQKVRVPLVVRLATGSLPLRELGSLAVGDVIKLETGKDEQAVVLIGGEPKFLARAGLDGTHRAAKILDPVPPDDEELYR